MGYALQSMLVVGCLVPAIAVAQVPKDAQKIQPKAPIQSPVTAVPERTTATFGDWTLRCEGATAPAKRVCEVALVISMQGQASPIAQLAIGKSPIGAGNSLTIALPPSISIGTRPQVIIAKIGAAPLELIWQRCTPGVCFASVAVGDEVISMLRLQTEPGRIQFKDAAERDTAIPVSFNGLSQALVALAKEP